MTGPARNPGALRVLVIGAGIGGLALAQGLIRRGIEVEVYERDAQPDTRLDRYRLHISPAGSRALHACLSPSAWEEFLAGAGRGGGGFGFLTEQLDTLVVVEDEIMYPPSHDPAEQPYPVDRRRLRVALTRGIEHAIHYDHRFVRYEHTNKGRIRATFTDDSDAIGDILIGADGAHSAVCRQLLPEAKPVDTGTVGVGLKLPLDTTTLEWLPPRLGTGMNVITAPGPMFLFTSVYQTDDAAGEDYLLCAFVARTRVLADKAKLAGSELQQAVIEIARSWHPLLQRVLQDADPASVTAYPFTIAQRPRAWSPSAVTVLGDAIHNMPPAGGNGANIALRDAHLLTRKLAEVARDNTQLTAAIGAYEHEMRNYAFDATKRSAQTLNLGLISNPLALAGTRNWFRICNLSRAIRHAGFKDNWAKDAAPRPWERHANDSPNDHKPSPATR